MKQLLLNEMLRFSLRMRRKRIKRLLCHFNITEQTRILDVGGSGDWDWKAFGVDAEVMSINLSAPKGAQKNYVQGSACDMHMFDDGEFDLVFSNSVIEHLQSHEDQRRMASEIERVGKAYWVQTPNRHFPVELHMCFPFFQYLPLNVRLSIARIWPFSFQRLRGKSAEADAQAILLSKRGLQLLFPESRVICERFCGVTKSLISMKGNDA